MGISGRIARAFLQSQLTPLIALVALLLGTFAVIVTPKEEEPQINVTMANVFIPFPGASAKDVETLVATPAEQVLSQVQGLEHVYSVSRPGVAILTVQYKVGVGREAALVRLWDAIHANRDWVSAQLGVGEPIIKAKGIDDVPIVALTLSTADSERGAFDLERVAHAMEVELKRVSGTREVTSIGGPGRKVRVLLDADKLSAYNVSPLEIQNALQLSNVALPSGNLVSNNQQIEIQTGNWLENARDVANLVVGVSEGNPVYLSDIARIVDGPDQPGRYVWSSNGPAAKLKGLTGAGEQPAVTIAITKKPGENAVDVADALIKRVDELKGKVIPAGVDVNISRNYGETANDKAHEADPEAGVCHRLRWWRWCFLHWAGVRRVIVGGAVVLTLAATLFASWAWGFTLNRVSLFALIFSIGILVDDAIVVVENIHRSPLAGAGQTAAGGDSGSRG
jgi:multidrug efflux pump subunit AcrB